MDKQKRSPQTVDEYVASYPEEVQQILGRLRAVIKGAAPQAEEGISYNMPGYKLNGFLVSFAVWKHHIGFYPRTATLLAALPELSTYKGTKGSVHFPLDQPLPYDLIGSMVRIRVTENLEN